MEEVKTVKYTQEGFNKLKEELAQRKEVDRVRIKQQLAEARSHGDLSENSEYDEARDAQAKNEARIAELEEALKHAEIIDESAVKSGVVNIGSVVTVYDMTFEEEVVYEIVGTNQVDAFENKISDQSPIGAALMGKRKGDIAVYSAPCGEVKLEIKKVSKKKKTEDDSEAVAEPAPKAKKKAEPKAEEKPATKKKCATKAKTDAEDAPKAKKTTKKKD